MKRSLLLSQLGAETGPSPESRQRLASTYPLRAYVLPIFQFAQQIQVWYQAMSYLKSVSAELLPATVREEDFRREYALGMASQEFSDPLFSHPRVTEDWIDQCGKLPPLCKENAPAWAKAVEAYLEVNGGFLRSIPKLQEFGQNSGR